MAQASVAVVIPSYNYAQFAEKTLASVFAQDLQPTEIFVVDDHSTDGTFEILQTYVPRITLISKPAGIPRGPAASQNIAIKQSKSTYIAFLDADDLWEKEYLSNMVAALEEHPDAALAYSNGTAIDPTDRPIYQLLPDDYQDGAHPRDLLLNCYICSPSKVVVRREIFARVGLFDEQLLYSHDHDMWLRIRESSRFVYVPKRLMKYRRHPTQGSRRREMWDTGFEILSRACKRYSYGGWAYLRRWAVLRFRIGEFHWKRHEAAPALVNFALAGLADPVRAAGEIIRRLQNRPTR